MLEDTPRIPQSLFYYPQEDALFAWTAKHNTHYTITRPNFILGAVREASMSVVHGLALYASIQKELGARLDWPADFAAWDAQKDLSTSKLIAYHAEWAVLTDAAKDQALNITDDSRFGWGVFWPTVASWYDISYGKPEEDTSKYTTITMPWSPPPRGFGPAGLVNVTFNFSSWAQKPEVKAAWETIQEREGLDKSLNPWRSEKALLDLFGTLDAETLGSWSRVMSMDKSRKLGWNGFVDTKVAIRDIVDKLAVLKMVPELK
jgi:hypothetical protein